MEADGLETITADKTSLNKTLNVRMQLPLTFDLQWNVHVSKSNV